MTHLSTSSVDRSWLSSHSVPPVQPLLCRRLHRFPPGYHSICCLQLRYRCSWLLSRTVLLCGSGSEDPKSASTPLGSCWPCDRAWRLLDSRDLQENEWMLSDWDWYAGVRAMCLNYIFAAFSPLITNFFDPFISVSLLTLKQPPCLYIFLYMWIYMMYLLFITFSYIFLFTLYFIFSYSFSHTSY